MSTAIFGIGISGLAAAQAGLLTTGHNISNANTAGYSRQEVTQGTKTPMFTGAGFIGQGVNVTSVRRVYSDFLNAQALQAQSSATHLDTYSQGLAQLSNLFSDTSSGIAPALTDFFTGVNAVAGNPSDIPSRLSMLSAGQALVGRFQQVQQQLEETRDDINAQVTTSVGTINSLATNIADLNKQIVTALAATAGVQTPNDLMDQRDALMTQLNGQLGTTSVTQSDGSLNVFLANGQALVVGQQSYQLATGPDETDPRNLQVGLKQPASASASSQFRAVELTGGQLGGLLAYRDNVLNNAENSLGKTALVMAQTFNDQHKLGVDLAGQPGGDFFAAPVPRVQVALNNTGTATISASVANASALTASDYSLGYDGTNYTLTRLSDNTTQTFATLPQTVDGVTITLAGGAAAAGDSFLIQPTRYAAGDIGMAISDPTKIAAAAPVRVDAATANTGTGLVSSVSVDASYLSSPLSGPLTVSYDSATAKLSGFPATQAVTVTVGTTSTTYPAGTAVPYTAGATLAFGGVSLTLSGSPANGDMFTVQPNTTGVGDNRNASLLADLQSKNVADNNTTTIGGTYAQMVSFIGNSAHQAQIEASAQDNMLSQAQQAVQSVSGVNLDEEAANLQRYQQAYQAAGKVLQVAASLFDTILNITNNQ
jgi:flagellar hook-associated protein 1 FlgK